MRYAREKPVHYALGTSPWDLLAGQARVDANFLSNNIGLR